MIHLHLSKKGKNFVENKEIGSSFRDTVNTAIEATRGAVVASTYIPPSGEWREKLIDLDREVGELRELQARKSSDIPTAVLAVIQLTWQVLILPLIGNT